MMKTNDIVRVDVGDLGEQIVQSHYGSVRADWFNNKRDGHIGMLSYEVKTMRLNHKTNTFWIDESQWKKVDGVDILFIVEIPEHIKDPAVLYLCVNHKTAYTNAPLGKDFIRGYYKDACLPITETTGELAEQLYNGSVQISKHKRFK